MICCACGEATEAVPCACGRDPRLDGRYTLDAPLSRGASGRLWAATGPDGPVALKEVPLPSGEAARKARELVLREAAVLRQLSHPGVPRFVEHLVVTDGRDEVAWLVEERVDGESLADETKRRRYTAEDVFVVVDGVLDVLSYLHGLSPPVVHRDVKPANVMRRRDGRLVLVDFGAVREAVRPVGGSTIAGTFGFMAPEQLVGEASPASDVYAVGVLALSLLTRKPANEIVDRRGVARLDGLGLRAPVEDALRAMVDPDPANRPQDAAEARRRLRAALVAPDLPAPASASGPVPALSWPTLSKKKLALAAIGATVGGMALPSVAVGIGNLLHFSLGSSWGAVPVGVAVGAVALPYAIQRAVRQQFGAGARV